MFERVVVRSRIGNTVLVIHGAACAIAAALLLAYFVATTWGDSGSVDRVLQLALLVAVFVAVQLFAIGRRNLRRAPAAPPRKTSSPGIDEAADGPLVTREPPPAAKTRLPIPDRRDESRVQL